MFNNSINWLSWVLWSERFVQEVRKINHRRLLWLLVLELFCSKLALQHSLHVYGASKMHFRCKFFRILDTPIKERSVGLFNLFYRIIVDYQAFVLLSSISFLFQASRISSLHFFHPDDARIQFILYLLP